MACRTIADIANNFHIGTDKTNKLAKQDIWLRPQLGVHYSDVIMSVMTSQVTDVSIVYLTVGSGTEQKKVKAPRHWTLWGEFTGDRWIPRTKVR